MVRGFPPLERGRVVSIVKEVLAARVFDPIPVGPPPAVSAEAGKCLAELYIGGGVPLRESLDSLPLATVAAAQVRREHHGLDHIAQAFDVDAEALGNLGTRGRRGGVEVLVVVVVLPVPFCLRLRRVDQAHEPRARPQRTRRSGIGSALDGQRFPSSPDV